MPNDLLAEVDRLALADRRSRAFVIVEKLRGGDDGRTGMETSAATSGDVGGDICAPKRADKSDSGHEAVRSRTRKVRRGVKGVEADRMRDGVAGDASGDSISGAGVDRSERSVGCPTCGVPKGRIHQKWCKEKR